METMDSFLIEELKNGNTRAFDRIFSDNYLNLCRFANSIVHDEDSAQNMVQQVFINLWENRKTLGRIERLIPYLTTSVRNSCLNNLKREKRNVDISALPDNVQTDHTTEQQLNLSDFEEQFIIALNSLPERCKMAFEYSRFEELTRAKHGNSIKYVPPHIITIWVLFILKEKTGV
jgi:RNA polymerase sigma-70 factor (ECF subfamily)